MRATLARNMAAVIQLFIWSQTSICLSFAATHCRSSTHIVDQCIDIYIYASMLDYFAIVRGSPKKIYAKNIFSFQLYVQASQLGNYEKKIKFDIRSYALQCSIICIQCSLLQNIGPTYSDKSSDKTHCPFACRLSINPVKESFLYDNLF